MTTRTHEPVTPSDLGRVQQAGDEIVVERESGWPSLRLRELWAARELLYFLIWRDVKVRYKQTALGIAWAVLQPVLTVVVFTVFFNRVAKITTGDVPYPVFALAGLVPWLFLANSVTIGSASLVSNANVVTKVYFPRLVVPVAATLSGGPDFVIAFVITLIVAACYGIFPTLAILAVPFVLLLVLATALGASIWLSAVNVEYRDVRYVVPVALQLWLLATPIAYPANQLHSPWNVIFGLNPMAGAVEAFRWAVIGTAAPSVGLLVTSTVVASLLLASGAYYFRAMERRFADVI
jgi:lipopolysaccharide transport system permease protein